MKLNIQLLAAVLALGTLQASPAQPATTNPAQPADWVDAEVRRIDVPGRKLTLRHGEIASLGMAAMTMVFVVKEGLDLAPLKVGDKLRFQAVKQSGQLTVTALQPG